MVGLQGQNVPERYGEGGVVGDVIVTRQVRYSSKKNKCYFEDE